MHKSARNWREKFSSALCNCTSFCMAVYSPLELDLLFFFKNRKKHEQNSRENIFTVSFAHPVQTDGDLCCYRSFLWSMISELNFELAFTSALCVCYFSLLQTQNWCQLKYFSCLCVSPSARPLNNNWAYTWYEMRMKNESSVRRSRVFIMIITMIVEYLEIYVYCE